MVVAGDAGFPEFPELFPAEDAVGGAKVDGQILFHGPVDVQGFFKIFAGQGPSGGDHGKPVGAGVLVGFGGFHHFFFGEEAVFFTAGMVAGRLGTVFAVFSTAAAPGVDDGAEIHMVSAEVLLDPPGFFLEFFQRLGQEFLDFRVFWLQPVTLHNPVRQCTQSFSLQ